MHDALANPMWTSLSTRHAGFALASGALKRFLPDVAPFCAVEHGGVVLDDTACLQARETVYFLGTFPQLPAHWHVAGEHTILQMVAAGAPPPAAAPEAPALGPADLADMLALTALVYPAFFRPRTAALGRYVGVRADGRLAAMAGQRLALPGYREISAVCTHPQHRGQGHAGRLIGQLARAIVAAGEVPFLHVSAANAGAWKLYQDLGFVASRELPFIEVRIGAPP